MTERFKRGEVWKSTGTSVYVSHSYDPGKYGPSDGSLEHPYRTLNEALGNYIEIVDGDPDPVPLKVASPPMLRLGKYRIMLTRWHWGRRIFCMNFFYEHIWDFGFFSLWKDAGVSGFTVNLGDNTSMLDVTMEAKTVSINERSAID